ncbi:MAG: hypothetical protein ABIJ59_00475 [Pseudomonadota bacterium]
MGDDYLPRLKESLKNGKIGLAKTLLADLVSKHTHEKLEVIELLALTPDKTALVILSFLTSKEYKDPEIYDRLIQLVIDRAHLNYNFVLILLENGENQTINRAILLIRHILSKETDKELLYKIIRTAGKMQIEKLTDDFAEFIFYDDATLKSEAIKALERIGTSNACSKLIQASKTEKCDQDILDAIQVLSANALIEEPVEEMLIAPVIQKEGTDQTYEQELDLLTSNDFEKRFEAFTTFSQKGPECVARLVKELDTDNHDLKINILRLIKRTIPVSAIARIFDILNQKNIESSIKFTAYSALESYPELKSGASVVHGLSEPALFVRIAAIGVLNKNLSDFVFAEIKNKIESGTTKGETLAKNILDARAEHMIERLMISDTFSYMASNYLARTAPIPVMDTFIKILEKRKLTATAQKYIAIRKERTIEKKKQFILISSSAAILNTYNKLISSCGFCALMFQNSQDAFEAIVSQQPDAIISDLFLDEMTGIDLARETRGLYTKNEVPIIISTLQKSLDKTRLQQEIDFIGITAICNFPATTSQIKSWVK